MFAVPKELLKQLFKKPETNPFPTKFTPSNVTKLLEKVGKGEAKINPPIETPEGFRGRLSYEKDKCIGCKQCIKVCPTEALEFDEKTRKIKHHVARCCFCSQCVDICPVKVDICPVKCLHMTNEFLISAYDKKMGFKEIKSEPKPEPKKEEPESKTEKEKK